jgi:hypothetical protein
MRGLRQTEGDPVGPPSVSVVTIGTGTPLRFGTGGESGIRTLGTV